MPGRRETYLFSCCPRKRNFPKYPIPAVKNFHLLCNFEKKLSCLSFMSRRTSSFLFTILTEATSLVILPSCEKPEVIRPEVYLWSPRCMHNSDDKMVLVRRKLLPLTHHWTSREVNITETGDRENNSGRILYMFNTGVGAMNRTSAQPQVKLSLLRIRGQ